MSLPYRHLSSCHSIYTYKDGELIKMLTYNFPGKNSLDYKGISYMPDLSVNSQLFNVESDSFIINKWLDNDNKPSVIAYSKKKNTFEEGFGFSPALNEQIFLHIGSVRNNQPGIWTCTIQPYYLLEYTRPEAPEIFRKGAEQLLENKSEEEVYEMNPIIGVIYLKN